MKHFLTSHSLHILLLALLLGACAPAATDSAAYSDREPIYIASFEVPPALVESAEGNCQKHMKFLNATVTYLRDGLERDLTATTRCYETVARRRTVEGQFNRNAKAAGYTPERGSSGDMDSYTKKGGSSVLFAMYRPEGNMTYVTIAHVERGD